MAREEIDYIKEPNIVIYKDGSREEISGGSFNSLWMKWCCGEVDYGYDKSID